jgi:hypothetical protein
MIGLWSFCLGPLEWMPPRIARQPAGVRVAAGNPFALEVSALYAEPQAYQWYRDGQPIFGANQSVLSVASAQLTDAGSYHVTVANFWGDATSQVAQVVVGYPLALTTNGPGRIDAQPAFEILEPGQWVTLTVAPAAGAVFEGWAGDLSGTANPATLTMDGPKQVQAWFSLTPLRLDISWQPGKARIEWTSPAVLQASDALVPGDWQDVSGAASSYEVEPANALRFYRLRRPRRPRCGKGGGEARAASGVRRFTGALREPPTSKAALKRTHSTRCATSDAGGTLRPHRLHRCFGLPLQGAGATRLVRGRCPRLVRLGVSAHRRVEVPP